MNTARFAIFNGPGEEFSFGEKQLPRCGAGELLVAITLATICGSDVHTVDGRRKEPVPCILGHEAVGIVIAAGEGRDPNLQGQKVTWTLADNCGECAPCCEWDLPQKCRSLFKYGHASLSDGSGLNGCYSTHILLRRGTTVIPIPADLPDVVAVSANCALATVMNATEQLPTPCQLAVVQGAGMLGLYCCAILKARGVSRVVVVDTNADRLTLVEAFGGVPVLGSALGTVSEGSADAVFEVAGVSAVVREGLRMLRPGGFYAFVGMVHPATELDITGEAIVRRCLTIRGFHNYAPRHLSGGIEFLRQRRSMHPWGSLVSHPFHLSQITAAFVEARTHRWNRIAIRP